MLTASRALSLNSKAGPELPRIPDLQPLYEYGFKFRQNELTMIAGRPGHQKSAFALWLAVQWGLPTIYFSADMTAFQASMRLASMATRRTVDQVSVGLGAGSLKIGEVLADVPITFSFGSPIKWENINIELEAFVELWNTHPALMVFDNLMDFDCGETDYAEQMWNLSKIDEMKRDLPGTSILLLHHATDKGKMAIDSPHLPPPRSEIKGGLGEKPENVLTVALNALDCSFRVAPVKQRMGASDASAAKFAVLQAEPEYTTFRRQ